MNKRILDKDIQQFIKENREKSPSAIALKKSPFPDVSSSELAAQIDGWQRSVRKLPTWAFSSPIYYPDKINLEQCSSEHTALVKQTLIAKGTRVVDITGGFGVDSCYMAQEAQVVIHCELNENLSEIVKQNAIELGVPNLICIATDGVAYINQQKDDTLDYIFIDPSRRVNHAKVFLLEDCEPNIVGLQDLFFQKSYTIISKLSPLMDISAALQKLRHIKRVYVISVDGDCKELLFVQERNYEGEAVISAIRIFQDQLQSHSFTMQEEKVTLIRTSDPLHYLYDPDVSVTKAGAFKTIAKRFDLYKLHQHTHLYTANDRKDHFPGRIFEVQQVYSLSDFKKENKIYQANVAIKNFPVKVVDIRKKFKIKDGGKDFLYFTTDMTGNHIVIHARRAQ
ncbi:THUMP-like domain-containing protein [Sphingobacterium lumbrici]|uniref:THUMP-like domain-containing protein n=1 Tax=Sphingobacterium lumbrici TaxID=2559600 RepID=UPI001127B498|nr:hypothetical protein [Sphingobacterium lumbrici]